MRNRLPTDFAIAAMNSISDQENCWQYLIYGSDFIGSTIGANSG